MPNLLTMSLVLLAAYAIYIAVQASRQSRNASDHVDAGGTLSGWTQVFAASGALVAGLGPYDHLRLVAVFGYQANSLFLSLVCLGLAAALFQKRLWLASRIFGETSPGDVFARYYQSPSIQIYMLGVALLFAVPFSAYLLSQTADLLAVASAGQISRITAVYSVGFVVFMFAALGGWRAVIYVCAALSMLMMLMLVLTSGLLLTAFGGSGFLQNGLKVAQGVVADAIPGVIQFSGGLGRAPMEGGMWTATAIASFAIAATGIALSPNFSFHTLTTQPQRSFAFSQVWMTAGLAAGLFLCLAPVLAAEIAGEDIAAFQPVFAKLSGLDELAGVALVLMLLSGLLLGLSYFAISGAHVLSREIVRRRLLPDLTTGGQRLAARIVLALMFIVITLLSGFAPFIAAAFAPLATGLAVQLFMAYLGLCWMPWLSRGAVLTGMVFGGLVVFFTEVPGLVLFDQLLVPLPWGRWPLTVHSAAWGLLINVVICLLIAIFNRRGAERSHRDRLHDIFARDHKTDFGGRASQGAKWSLTLTWTFLAIGPGAVIGNTFFSKPIFSSVDVKLGVPSLWVWQICFWVIGVFLTWWLAYRTGLSVVSTKSLRFGELSDDPRLLGKARQPEWMRLLVDRLSKRSTETRWSRK